MTPLVQLLAVAGYVLVFFAVLAGLLSWRKRRRNERWPVETKLRRGPGESLRRRIDSLVENLPWRLCFGALGPPLFGSGILWFLGKTAPTTRLDVALTLAGVITAALLVITGTWLFRYLRNISNHRLGHYGERVVAEALEPLVARGYRVFHDVPMEGRTWRANIDHVVIGPTGVTVVETKAIRRRRGLSEREGNVLDCSGPLLRWPWGDGRVGLDQCVRNADWLRKWIKQGTGWDVTVTAVLTFPGWYIKPAPNRHSVIPTQWLPDRIPMLQGTPLSPEQIDLIARQLDVVCRDVED